MLKLNKKAAGEAFSWTAGLIAILMIIVFAIIAFKLGHIGEKKPISIDLTNNNALANQLQRIGAYAISSDFNGSEKGKILFEIYSNVKEGDDYGNNYGYNPQVIGILLENFPLLSLNDYQVIKNIGFGLSISNSFYLPCKNCENKYLTFGLGANNNGK